MLSVLIGFNHRGHVNSRLSSLYIYVPSAQSDPDIYTRIARPQALLHLPASTANDIRSEVFIGHAPSWSRFVCRFRFR